MPRKKDSFASHTGRTVAGNTRDVKVERIGKITIYKRGETYCLYYRQGGVSHRRRIDGNLAAARATAHKVQTALDERKPSPIAYARTKPEELSEGFLDAVATIQKLALRTQDRYRAALNRFTDFCRDAKIGTIDSVDEATVGDFVKWLRGQKRTRNGAVKGRRDSYKVGGVKFILSTCRTAFNWAARRRKLPPFRENPFTAFGIDTLTDDTEKVEKAQIFTAKQEHDFFKSCDGWERDIFGVLATYGLRVGELTHLLVGDVDLASGTFVIRSKPWLFWTVKTGRDRQLPLLPGTREIFLRAMNGRRAGFVFLNKEFVAGDARSSYSFSTAGAFKGTAEKIIADLLERDPDANERAQKRVVVAFCRSLGQIPDKRLRCAFMARTKHIGCPEFTRVHDLRHLFSTRAQSAGVNPLLVQELLGHASLSMTQRYTHFTIETKRHALQNLLQRESPMDKGKVGANGEEKNQEDEQVDKE